jgi:hypothetical protein
LRRIAEALVPVCDLLARLVTLLGRLERRVDLIELQIAYRGDADPPRCQVMGGGRRRAGLCIC